MIYSISLLGILKMPMCSSDCGLSMNIDNGFFLWTLLPVQEEINSLQSTVSLEVAGSREEDITSIGMLSKRMHVMHKHVFELTTSCSQLLCHRLLGMDVRFGLKNDGTTKDSLISSNRAVETIR